MIEQAFTSSEKLSLLFLRCFKLFSCREIVSFGTSEPDHCTPKANGCSTQVLIEESACTRGEVVCPVGPGASFINPCLIIDKRGNTVIVFNVGERVTIQKINDIATAIIKTIDIFSVRNRNTHQVTEGILIYMISFLIQAVSHKNITTVR